MDDIAGKISALLDSPEGMEKLRSAADALLSGGKEEKESFSLPDNMGGIMAAAKALSAGQNDPRVKLLLALKPHLSQKRGERVDKAVRILQLINAAPLLEGIF